MIRFRLRMQLQEWELPYGTTVVGRDPTCNLSFDDPLLSREHAAIVVSDARVCVRDLGSRNGTLVNGQPIVEETELRHGDRLRFGRSEAIFGRTVGSRRDLATTAGFHTCRACGRAHVAQAPTCPHCGVETEDRSASGARSEVSLLDKALSLYRLEDARQAFERIERKLAAARAEGARLHPHHLEDAARAAIRLAHLSGRGAPIAWAIDSLLAAGRPPDAGLLASIAEIPPIVLEEAVEALGRLVSTFAHDDDSPLRSRLRTRLHEANALHANR
jgi:hypothetical protein